MRGFKLFTGSEALILGVAAHLSHSKLSEGIGQLVAILSACLRDEPFWNPDADVVGGDWILC
jgi:hypothetical protein